MSIINSTIEQVQPELDFEAYSTAARFQEELQQLADRTPTELARDLQLYRLIFSAVGFPRVARDLAMYVIEKSDGREISMPISDREIAAAVYPNEVFDHSITDKFKYARNAIKDLGEKTGIWLVRISSGGKTKGVYLKTDYDAKGFWKIVHNIHDGILDRCKSDLIKNSKGDWNALGWLFVEEARENVFRSIVRKAVEAEAGALKPFLNKIDHDRKIVKNDPYKKAIRNFDSFANNYADADTVTKQLLLASIWSFLEANKEDVDNYLQTIQ